VRPATGPTRLRIGPVTLSPCHLVTLSCLLAAGCGYEWPGKPQEKDRPVRPDKELDFDVLFKQNCRGCHGEDGQFGPAPPLNDPVFLAIVPDEDLLHVIAYGRPVNGEYRTPMPAFARANGGPLTDEQVRALAQGIKEKWGTGRTPTETPPRYREPSWWEARGDQKQGLDLFATACAGCHGEAGEGGRGMDGGPINDPAFLSLISDQALRRIVITGRPDLGMPHYAGKEERGRKFKPLTDQDVTDLTALLASWRSGKAQGK
jgi:cytochrome c oxidase cbb3-type subunit III